MIKLIPWFTITCLLSAPAVMAGAIIEIQNNNEVTAVMTDGNQARMNTAGSDYIIVDYSNHSVRMVSPQKQQVLLLDANGAVANKAPLVHTAVKNLGAGHAVAGYNTQKFGFTANGRSCGVIYGSKDAYQAKGIKDLLAAMTTMMQQQRDMLGGFASLVDDCTLADMSITDHINTIGVPMRTEKNGKVETEVRSIKTDVAIPADAFLVPASYKTVNVLGQQQEQQHKPQIQQMAQQVQRAQQLLQYYQHR